MTRTRRRAGVNLLTALLAIATAGAQRQALPEAVLAGGVFRDNGFALSGAEVAVAQAPKPKQKWKTVSNGRGEFAIRVPPGPMRYTVTVKADGFKPQEKEVSVAADERIELNFIMDPSGRP